MVENVSQTGNSESPVTRHIVDNQHKVSIDDARLLFQGDYARDGHDLLISHDGRTVVLQNYFLSDGGPSLAGPNGAFLSHETVSALAGPIAPGQYAQAGTGSGLVEIGKIVKLTGTAKSQHTDGVEVDLALGDPVYQGDVLSTGPDSALGISFVDESVFSMSAEARMVLDELVYDPGDAENSSMVFNLVEGAFVFVTGEIAPTGNMKVETPVATMGIRGTTPKVLINTALGVVEFSILPDPDSGDVGVYQIINRETGALMGTVESSGDKWVVTTLNNEAVRITKSGLDLLNDQIALDEIRDVFSRALGDRTQLDGTNSFGNVSFDSSASEGGGADGDGGDGEGGGTGGGTNTGEETVDADDPPIAGDDAFTVDEDSFVVANVIDGSVGGADVDPDGFALKVTQVDGTALVFAPGGGFATVNLPSGAVLNIRANGNFNYDPGDAFDFLAVGEEATDTFTYTIRDAGGFTDTATVTVTLEGRNDQPEIQIVDANGSITDIDETAGEDPPANAGELSDSGSITFTDVDLTDRPTASITGVSVSGLAQDGTTPLVLTPGQLQAISEAFSITAGAGNTNNGTIVWNYVIQEESLDFLGTDEVVTALFTVTINDNRGFGAGVGNNEISTASQVITIIINGSTVDQPVISVLTDDSASEDLFETDAGLATSGTLTVNDVDFNDTVTVSVESVVASGTTTGLGSDNAALLAMLTLTGGPINADIGDENNIDWSFASGAEAFDYLAVSEVLTLTYSVQAQDSQGDLSNIQTITITVTGTNDAPVIDAIAQSDLTEQTDTDPLTTSIAVTFTDVDLTDVGHTATVTAAVTSGVTDGLALDEAGLIGLVTPGAVTKNSGSDAGNVALAFSAASTVFDYLADGEVVTLTYTLDIDDGDGGLTQQDFVVTVTGTNDAPVASVEAGDDVTETLAEAETAITADGSFTVSDVDITDEVTVKSITVATSDNDAGAPGDTALLDMMTLTPDVAGSIINGASTTGSVSWAFDSGADQFDYLAVGEQLTLTYTATVIDDESAEDTQDIVITITGTNDMPVITAGDVSENLDESETAIQANGSFDVEDVDISDEITVSGITVAKTGIISHAPSNAALLAMFTTTPGVTGIAVDNASTTGTVNWTFNSGADQFDYLAVGQQLTITYTVTVDDGNGGTDTQDVTIVVTGTNDEPFVNTPDATRDLDESETAITASGTFNVGDVDVADTVTLNGITVVTSGVDGGAPANGALLAMFSITDPLTATVIGNATTVGSVDWAFDSGADQFDYLADGEVLTLTYTIEVIDDHGATADHVVTINVTGTNDDPVADADSATTDEDVAVTIDVLDGDTDVDDGAVLGLTGFAQGANGTVTRDDNGTPGDLTDDQLVYTPDDDFSGIDTFTYTVEDEHGASDTETVTVTVTPVADAPLALSFDAGDIDPTLTGQTNDFLVNTTSAGNQHQAAVAALPGIGFVVVWTSANQDGSGHGVYGQGFDGAGNPLGSEFQINTYTNSEQERPAVTGLPDGSFVVTWQSNTQDTDVYGVYARHYDDQGNPSAAEFQVNTTVTNVQYLPSIAALADGSVVITWTAGGAPDGADTGVYGQIYDASGDAVGGEFLINTYTASHEQLSAVAGLAGGGFVVTWQTEDHDGDGYGIFGQLYDGIGNTVGSEFLINSHTANDQQRPSVAGLADGGFVVTWMSQGQDGDDEGTFAQIFDASGAPVGSEFQVNTTVANEQSNPSVTALADGGFLIVWTDPVHDGAGFGLFAQRFDASGNQVGSEFLVNEITNNDSFHDGTGGGENTALLDDGSVVVTWTIGTVGGDILARIFDVPDSVHNENDPVAIPLTASLADIDGSETLSIILSGFPAGSTFNLGAASGGDWVIANAQAEDLSTLVMTPPTGWDGTFTLSATARSTEGLNGDFEETTATTDITIVGPNDPPVVVAGGTLAWENGDGAQPIDGALTVSDVDSPMLIGGTVAITGGHDANDVLGFATQNGISGSYNAGTGVLTLTGTATVAHYEDALRSVTFNTSGSPPSGADREVTFVVNDGDDDSVAATSTVTVEPYNQITGSGVGETLNGTAVSDMIFGLDGNDTILGNDEADILIGGLGADNLTGGAGSDIFVFDDLLSVDTVLDFNASADNILDPGEDIVDLEALLSGTFDPGTPGDEITFEDNAPDGVTLVVNGNPVANLNGVSDGEFVHVIHDQAEAAIAVQISLIS